MTRRAPQDDDSFDPDDYVFWRGKNGQLHVNLDKLLLYGALLIALLIGLVAVAIKAIRWAVTS